MNKSITYKQLAIVIITFVLGITTTLLTENYLLAEKIQFDTLGLIGFVFSIIFGGASIVLAITAINLGKISEQLMIERSQKSIELQNEVYIKTTEALKRIESSTGVTEKRIEDIISGRVGDLANRLVDDQIVPGRNKEQLEKELRRTLSKELTPEEMKREEEKKRQKDEARKRYHKFKDDVLLSITNLPNVKALKIGDGTFKAKGTDLIDGLFEINNLKVGICNFFSDESYIEIFGTEIDVLLNNLAVELSNKTFDKVYLVFNEESKLTEKYSIEIEKVKKLLKDEIADNIVLFAGSPDKISESIEKYAPQQ